MMKTITLALFLVSCLFGQTTNNPAQSPDKILSRAAKALGGEKALRAVTSRRAAGKITRAGDETTGNYQTETLSPNYYREIYDLNGLEFSNGYNAKSAWRRDSKNGLRTLTGEATRDFQALAAYRNVLWLNYKREKSKIVFAGTSVVVGKNADAVTLTTAKNVRIKIYFDRKTGLPVREEIPGGDETEIYDYDDYRTVDGINEPFSITEISGGEKYVVKIDRIAHNQTIAKSVFDFPQVSNEPLPDITALLKQVEANEDKVDEILENYTYTETQIKRETGADGIPREREIEKNQITFYKGFQIRRLISKDGKPLAPDEAAAEDKKAAGHIAEIDEKISKRNARAAGHSAQEPTGESGERISIGEILRASTLTNPRREQLRGRDVIVFDFQPNPNFDYSNAKSLLKFFGKTAGAIWIDEKDRQVARVEAALVDNFNVAGGFVAKLKRGASFTLEQNRVNDEIWLPVSADINLSARVLLVKEFNINQNVRFGDYQKFKAEASGAKINEAAKP